MDEGVRTFLFFFDNNCKIDFHEGVITFRVQDVIHQVFMDRDDIQTPHDVRVRILAEAVRHLEDGLNPRSSERPKSPA